MHKWREANGKRGKQKHLRVSAARASVCPITVRLSALWNVARPLRRRRDSIVQLVSIWHSWTLHFFRLFSIRNRTSMSSQPRPESVARTKSARAIVLAHFEYLLRFIQDALRSIRHNTLTVWREDKVFADHSVPVNRYHQPHQVLFACRFIWCDVLIMRDSCFRWSSECYLFTCLLRARDLSSVNCNAVRMKNRIEILFFLAGCFPFFLGFVRTLAQRGGHLIPNLV